MVYDAEYICKTDTSLENIITGFNYLQHMHQFLVRTTLLKRYGRKTTSYPAGVRPADVRATHKHRHGQIMSL